MSDMIDTCDTSTEASYSLTSAGQRDEDRPPEYTGSSSECVTRSASKWYDACRPGRWIRCDANYWLGQLGIWALGNRSQ